MKKVILLLAVILFFGCEKNSVGPNDAQNNEERILFLRYPPKQCQICSMLPDGSNIKIIAEFNATEENFGIGGFSFAKWAPDKSSIVVEGGPGSTLEYKPLWLLTPEGEYIKQLTPMGHTPFWSNDGKYIFFTRRTGYFSLVYNIYMIDVNTGKETLVLDNQDGINEPKSGFVYQIMDVYHTEKYSLLLREHLIYENQETGKQSATDGEFVFFDIEKKQKEYITQNDIDEGWGKLTSNDNSIIYSIFDKKYVAELNQMLINDLSITNLISRQENIQINYLCLSPDGEKIGYSAGDKIDGQSYNPKRDIYFMDIQSKIKTQLTKAANDTSVYYIMDWR